MKKIKILILINRLAPGGAPTRILRLLNLINREEFDFTVCAFTKTTGDLEEAYNQYDIKTIYLKGRCNPFSLLKLYKILVNNKFDILHTFLPFSGVTGRILGRIARVKGIISSQENIIEAFKLSSRLLEMLTLNMADIVTCISKTVEKSFFGNKNKKGNFKIVTIYNAIDISRIDSILNDARREKIRADFSANDAFIICNVARLEPQKDQLTLIRAFDSISQQIPNAQLWIIGWGQLEKKLKKYVDGINCRKRIKFLGKRHDVITLLSAIDIFVLSSKYEGLSGALLEAMAARKPVIVSDIPQNLEVVIDGKTGVVFNCGDPVSLTNAILKIYNNPDYARILAENGRKRLEEVFSLDIMIPKYEKIYKELYAKKL